MVGEWAMLLPRHILHEMIGWWFGTFFLSIQLGIIIIPSDEVHHFSEG
jgi:hypothetical protein